ncbi:MAG: MFS transporter [Halobacteriales archaeon]
MADEGGPSVGGQFRQFLALERDVLVLSIAMFAFSLGFQMTGRYMPRYLDVLGAGAVAIGAYKSLGDLISAVYPYPGGAISDRIGTRRALTLFGVASTAGFVLWLLAARVPTLRVGPLVVPTWVWVFPGLFLVQAWKSFGLGATFALVKQSVPRTELATGFATTETVRRVAFLAGPLAAAVLLARGEFRSGFLAVLAVSAGVAALGTVAQHYLYDPGGDTVGSSFEGVAGVVADLRSMPPQLPPLLAGDALVRWANGMVYAFFVLVVTDLRSVGFSFGGVAVGGASVGALSLNPDAYFGVLLAVEMAVALATMVPSAKLARRVGLKPVVALGFLVYGGFPALLIGAPADQWAFAGLFALSGLRFAGLPAHKALIVGPAERDAGGRVTGSYYLLRNAVTVPAGVVGGVLYAVSPELSFWTASVVGIVGVAVFLAFGEELDAYD